MPYNISINGLDDGTEQILWQFADTMNLGGVVDTSHDCVTQQAGENSKQESQEAQ